MTTALTPTIDSWRASLQRAADEIRAKYAQPRTASVLLADLDKWTRIAGEFTRIIRQMSASPTRPEDIRRADENLANLTYLKSYVVYVPATQVPRQSITDRSVAAMVAPIEWLQQVGTPALQRSAEYGEMVRTATDAPGESLKYLLDQIRKSLKLPSWFVPVVAGTAVVGLGAWAYFTFLAPVTRATRVVRRNPRRGRR